MDNETKNETLAIITDLLKVQAILLKAVEGVSTVQELREAEAMADMIGGRVEGVLEVLDPEGH